MSKQNNEKQEIEKRKKTNLLRKHVDKAFKDSIPERCLYCGADINYKTVCNSHSVPEYILKNIAINGYLLRSYCADTTYNMQMLKESKVFRMTLGVNETGVFKLLCTDCDKKIFRNYEDKKAFTNKYSENVMLNEIALKNQYFTFYKKKTEKNMQANLETLGNNIPNSEKASLELAIKEVNRDIKRSVTMIHGDDTQTYKMIWCKKLNYVVPYAGQTTFSIENSIRGQRIVDTKSPTDDVTSLHLCIFPLENSSIIMLFYHECDIAYQPLIGELAKEEDALVLKILNFMMLAYCEDIYFSPLIEKTIKEDKTIRKCVELSIDDIDADLLQANEKRARGEIPHSLNIRGQAKLVTNLLEEKYAVPPQKKKCNEIP